MIFPIRETWRAEGLFGDWPETILWSCLQGVMGGVYGDDPLRPRSAAAILGDFCFLAGEVNRELVGFRPGGFHIMIPQNERWSMAIEERYGGRVKRITRYAVKKEKDVFDGDRLRSFVRSLPKPYELRLIDRELFALCRAQAWSRDLVSQFSGFEMFERLGVGVVALKGEELVSGASSYSRYEGGIEVEIDTREDCRRRGLALACGAGLILECRRRGLYPSWDAHNPASLALAGKLGYHADHPYPAYEICEE